MPLAPHILISGCDSMLARKFGEPRITHAPPSSTQMPPHAGISLVVAPALACMILPGTGLMRHGWSEKFARRASRV